MKLVTALATSLCLFASASTPPAFAQKAVFNDPANLRGERATPRTGHELDVDQGARGLEQILRRLNTRASLLLIVAHPDDEDGGMLTLNSRGLGARVATLTLNRGEGGQNAKTGDFEDALGLLRTQELLSADRYFGAHQMFGTEIDFGFSKTKEEAFAKWTYQRVLYDAVRAVRLYRPMVIAAVFIGGVTDGHGQHQVSGQIAQQVFNAAADPKVFPELTAEGILPWAPLKVYARVPAQAITPQGLFDYATGQYTPARFTNYVTGEVTTTIPSTDVVVHEGNTDPILSAAAGPGSGAAAPGEPAATSVSYVQFARIGLGLQKTQIGPGMRLPPPGAFDIGYHRYGSRLAHQPAEETTFFDGIDTSLEGIADLDPEDAASLRPALHSIAAKISEAQQLYDPHHTEASAPPLAEAQAQLQRLLASLEQAAAPPAGTRPGREQRQNVVHELRVKRVQLNQALALSLGLQMDATTTSDQGNLIAGTAPRVQITVTKSTPGDVTLLDEEISGGGQPERKPYPSASERTSLLPGTPIDRTLSVDTPSLLVVTRPYFSRPDIEQAFYNLDRPDLREAPATPPALVAHAVVQYKGQNIQLATVIHDGPQPISFVPSLSVSLSSHAQVLASGRDSFMVGRMEAPAGRQIVSDTLGAPPAWSLTPLPGNPDEPGAPDQPGVPEKAGHTEFRVTVPAANRQPATLHASATLRDGATYTEGFRGVGYPGLIYTNFYRPAIDRIVPVDLKLPSGVRIAYLPGTGDSVPSALSSIGLSPTILSVADLTPGTLKEFDTVILGVRTYNAHPDLHGAPTQALLDYARGGGNVLLEYQTSEFTAADAPFPLTLGYSAEKVVDETDPVRILVPASPLLTAPNRITPADFNSWIEERGHGFLGTWDSHYTALTETHDPGQLPQMGGLISTPVGKGRWTYCAFALYRQLPEAVPGGYRLLIDLINP